MPKILDQSGNDIGELLDDYSNNLKAEFQSQIQSLTATGQEGKLKRIGDARTILERQDNPSMEGFNRKSQGQTALGIGVQPFLL